jgi:serine/threonine protein kinase
MNTAPKSSGGLPRVGDIVAGKYEVERILGSGGMGIVVLARHKHLGEPVAIKLLHPDAAMDGESVARLLREARATISIKSEHVIRILDVGTLDTGSPYILMEYLMGSDLAELLKRKGPFEVSVAADYLLQACEAIAEAHARGIVHRDLKPSNLFLTERLDGSLIVKVLDFGISKSLAGDDTQAAGAMSLTATRAVFGSPLYMSPEQVRSAKRVDERTDIWSLGIILHELLTGSLPFSGETMPGVLASIVADAPEPLRRRRENAPEALERVVAQCLVKDAAKRFQTVAELAGALAPFAPETSRATLERIIRVSMPGGVSKRALPARSSSPPSSPSSPGPLALGSTFTVKEIPRPGEASRRTRWLMAAAACTLGVVLGVAWLRAHGTPGSGTSAGASPDVGGTQASTATVPAFTFPPSTPATAPASDAGTSTIAASPAAPTAPKRHTPVPAPEHSGPAATTATAPPSASAGAPPATAPTDDLLNGR